MSSSRASRLSGGRLALGFGNAGETPGAAGETPAPLPEQLPLNIAAPENRVYEGLNCDARWYLERLARVCLRRDIATSIRVRVGRPADEILAEAAAGNADLIVLPSYPPPFWKRLFGPILPRVVAQVIRKAPCRVFQASPQDRFDCEDVWGRSGNKTHAALEYRKGTSGTDTSPMPQPAHAFAAVQNEHRAVAYPG